MGGGGGGALICHNEGCLFYRTDAAELLMVLITNISIILGDDF